MNLNRLCILYFFGFLLLFLVQRPAHATNYATRTLAWSSCINTPPTAYGAGHACTLQSGYPYCSVGYCYNIMPGAINLYTWTADCTAPQYFSETTGACMSNPVCLTPQVLNTSTHLCYTPVECRYPEVDNGSGVCQNLTCAAGQNRNPTTKNCQTYPTCASSESYNIYSNSCVLVSLHCPGHSHPSATNDSCLPDAPLTCPTGQHDDGTYNCIANDATACKSNQVAGYINSIPQCITKTNTAQATSDSQTAETANAASVATAKTAADAAQAALAADPTNVTKQATNTAAQSTYNNAMTKQNEALLSGMAKEEQGLDQKLQTQEERNAALDAQTGVVAVNPDVVATETITAATVTSGSSGGVCPSPSPYTVHGTTYYMSYQPYCDFASGIRPMVLSLAWLSSAFIVFGIVSKA